jgi:hypothetical protein
MIVDAADIGLALKLDRLSKLAIMTKQSARVVAPNLLKWIAHGLSSVLAG